MVGLRPGVPQLDFLVFGVGDVRRRRFPRCRSVAFSISTAGFQIPFQTIVRNDLGSGLDKLPNVARMILMNVSDEDVLDRLIGDGFDLSHEFVVELVAQILGIDQNHSLIRNAER